VLRTKPDLVQSKEGLQMKKPGPLIVALVFACVVAYASVAEAAPDIGELIPSAGCYGGTIVKVVGSGFGEQRSEIVDADDGYHSFVTLSLVADPDTIIATWYPSWSDTEINFILVHLFVDSNDNYIQDANEPLLTVDQLLPGAYDLTVDTVSFQDNNGNGIYDNENELSSTISSSAEVFNVTNTPAITVTLAPDSTVVYRGENLRFQVNLINHSYVTATVFVVTRVVLLGRSVYPSSGYLIGPKRVTLPPNEFRSAYITHRIPQSALLGTHRYYAAVAMYDVGIRSVDSFSFKVAHYSDECSDCHFGIHHEGHMSVPCTSCHGGGGGCGTCH
jgi:hypothetical protein